MQAVPQPLAKRCYARIVFGQDLFALLPHAQGLGVQVEVDPPIAPQTFRQNGRGDRGELRIDLFMPLLVAENEVGFQRRDQFQIDGVFRTQIDRFGHGVGDVVVPGITGPGLGGTDRGDAKRQQGLSALVGEHDDPLRVLGHVSRAHGVFDFVGTDRRGQEDHGRADQGAGKRTHGGGLPVVKSHHRIVGGRLLPGTSGWPNRADSASNCQYRAHVWAGPSPLGRRAPLTQEPRAPLAAIGPC